MISFDGKLAFTSVTIPAAQLPLHAARPTSEQLGGLPRRHRDLTARPIIVRYRSCDSVCSTLTLYLQQRRTSTTTNDLCEERVKEEGDDEGNEPVDGDR